MKMCRKDLRVSRDWLGNSWINIKAKPEITTTIFIANNSFNTKLSVCPSTVKDADSVGFANSCHGYPVSKKSSEPAIDEENLVRSDGSAEEGNCLQDSKPSSEKSTQPDNTEIHGSCDNEDNAHDNGNANANASNDDGGKKNGDDNGKKDTEVFGTSGPDCEPVEFMEVAV